MFLFFQNFHIFTNIFNQHFYETRSNPNKLFVYLIGPHADGIDPALGRQSVLQVCPPVTMRHKLAATALILSSDMWEYVMESA